MKKIILSLLLIAFGGTFLYFLKNQEASAAAADSGATPTGINSVIKANNQFAFDLYSESRKKEGNIFFSPYSISTALAMTYEGARGKTAEEIQSVFHFPSDGNIRKPAFAAIHNQLNPAHAKYKLSIANALWAQNDYRFLDEYIHVLQQYYAGKAANVDFKNATEDSRRMINQWVEDGTNQKIKDLFPQGSLNDNTRLVLTNVIYFKGTWAKQFKKDQTEDENFRINSTHSIKVPMMQQTDEEAKFNYTETDKLQILELPYQGEKLSMLVLLPKGDRLSNLETSLSLNNINDWRSKLRERRVDVFMPKFTFNTKYFLNETLATMGMPTAFTDDADLSGMDGTKTLLIQKVIHQAFVDVNEEGTEAAAATGVTMGITSAAVSPITVFRADHPFIFIIQDRESGNILFLGRVVNPVE